MNNKPNNIIRVQIDSKDFFRFWLMFLKPFHKLTNRELDVAARFLKERFELSKAVSDYNLLNRIVFNEETKRKIQEECGLSKAHFKVVFSNLKKNKVIVNGEINKKLIPNIIKEGDMFQLLYVFDFNDSKNSNQGDIQEA